MNGPDHYREAEKAIREAWACDRERESYYIGLAQVHAALALVAAQVDLVGEHDEVMDRKRDWSEEVS